MLEGLVTWVLNNYVGEYLENLNADQISIALLQGQVELENVPLRKTALRKFDVPLEVKSGIIGKLTLSVPIAHIKSEPWVLKMSDLLILLGPNSDPSSNLDLVEESEQSKKEQMYEELEKLHKKSLLDAASINIQLEESQNAWWGASLVSAVSNNIQLILNNLHIRYEDDTTMPDKMPFHFGFRIHNISIQTTNSQWKPGFVQPEDGTNTFKKLDVKGFSVFWNCSQEMDVDIDTYEKLKKILAPETTKNNTFILKPFSMAVRMEKNASKFPLKQNPPIPRFMFDLRPERIEIELSKRQLAQIRVLSAEWARFDRARQHRKWRPLTRIVGNSKVWWKFAYGRIAEDNRKQRSTASVDFVLNRAKLLNNYCKSYTRKLKAFVADQRAKEVKVKDPNAKVAPISAASPEDTAYMKQIEHDSEFTYNELHLFREIVFRKYLKQIEREQNNNIKESDSVETFEVVSPDSEPSRSRSHGTLSRETSTEPPNQMSNSMYDQRKPSTASQQIPVENGQEGPGFYGWLASWFSGAEDPNKKPKEDDINQASFLNMWPQEGNRELPPNLRKVEKRIEEELLDVLSESWDDSTILRRDNLLAEVVLQLERMIVRFVDDDELTCLGLSRVLALDMSSVASRVLLSPREHRTEISLSVMDMSVQRLRVAPQKTPDLSRGNSVSDLQEDIDDSLWTGVGIATMDTEVLFAVGRTKSDDKTETNTMGSEKEKKMEPLLQFFYRRLAPRLNVFHEIKASFLPIAVVYDEDALDGLASLFDTDSAFFSQDQTKEKEQEAALKEFEPDNQIFLTINIPEVLLELRSKRKSPTADILLNQNSQPFASARITSVSMGLARTEKFVSRMKLGFDQFELKDMFEKTNWPLLKTIPPNGSITGSKTLSRSLPTLTDTTTSHSQSSIYSSSLPSELKGTSILSNDITTAKSMTSTIASNNKRTDLALDNDFGHWDQSCVLLNLIFVDEKHPKFEEVHEKQHCTVKANLSEVELGMNIRTWTMLLNFFGALGQKPGHHEQIIHELPTTSEAKADPVLEAFLYGKKMSEDEILKSQKAFEDAKKKITAYNLRLQLDFDDLSVNMNYPANNTQLGQIAFENSELDLKLNLSDPEDPMKLLLAIGDVSLSDLTPFYSDKYGQRVVIERKVDKELEKADKITVDVLKYRTDDFELARKFDIKVDVKAPKEIELFYVHTHRYFCALLDFWFNFADLGDQVRRKNEKLNSGGDSQKTRCLLNVDLLSPTQLILPLNQFSDDLIFLETDSVHIENKFLLGSQTKELEEHAIETLHGEDDYDCLLDKMSVNCAKVRIYPGKRIDCFEKQPLDRKMNRRVGQEVFEDFYLEIQNENVLNKPFDLKIEVFKNLSSFISHNLPELSILTHFEDLELKFSVEFYKLLRGFLEKNLGDQLIPNPDTIPFEVLQCPDRGLVACTAQKYATFSNRMDFRNVTFHFLNSIEGQTGAFQKFAKVLLHKARISFDSYIDNQSELDIICESSELADSRYDDLPANQRPNIFTTIVQPRRKGKISEGNTMSLMSEAHIMMKKDEAPVVTLVLMNSRVLLILDWLNMAKDFVLQNSDFTPPEEPTRTNVRIPFAVPKEGILLRNGQNEKKPLKSNPHTITLKITLKESDLVLLENSSRPNSLALVGHTTAVLGLHDQTGVFEGNFEVQNIGLSWCLMSAEASTHCQISNEFDLAASLAKEPQSSRKKRMSGLDSLEMAKFRQCLSIGLGEMVFRLSYKDILVVQSVLTGAFERLAPPKNAEYQRSGSPPSLHGEITPAPINIKSIDLTAPSLSVWLLDDSQNVALPLVRLVMSDLKLCHVSEKIDMALRLNVDYFNQRVFGWEPLLEPWQIEKIEVICGIHNNSLKVQPALRSPLNFNVSQAFVQQAKHFSSKWAAIKAALESDLRTMCVRSRSDHLPYLLKNETGSNLIFTTAVDEIMKARKEQRKANAKWFTALTDKSCTFEFPAKLLTVRDRSTDPRSLVIRVEGWDEVTPVSVDSVGTYFRVARLSHSTDENEKSTFGRIVIAVSMEPNGRKVVTVRSALLLVNQLADPVHFSFIQQKERYECDVLPGDKLFAPLRFVGAVLLVRPKVADIEKSAELKWSWAKQPGEVNNKLICFSKSEDEHQFWVCVSVKREHYPEAESLCGHSIYLIPTLNVLNLLPTDVELTCNGETHSIQAGQRLQSATVNLEKRLLISIASDKFRSDKPATIQRSRLSERQDGTESCRILLRLFDQYQRELHIYASVSIIRGGAVHISLWVPFWIVNRSGIPLVIKQEAADQEAAGQMADHESAKDRNPMMFSFSDPDCPSQCVVRIGSQFQREYKPKFSRRFTLVPGVQSLQLMLTHDTEATQIYNIGVEVRQGTGRYKDTQVVLLAPRYRLNNQSGYEIYVSHPDEVNQQHKQVCLAAKSNLIWHESFEDKRMLCAKRLDTAYWSCPFRIDQVGSFHVTMRDRDETPRFVRVEVTLNSASFWVTFTDASFFPAPIQIENRSTVPVLYHQHTESARRHHLRTICKANSVVEYAWDDLYAQKLLTLQVYENKSHTYDPSKPSQGPPLVYENHIYIQFYPSFKRVSSNNLGNPEETDLVFTCRKEGKIQLTRQNLTDSSHSQLWTFTNEHCLENVGFNYRQHQKDKKFVLDVLDNGSVLMMRERDPLRNTTQKWRFTNDGRLRCGLIDRFVEAKGTTLFLSPVQVLQTDDILISHRFRKQRQKPGSGVLDVQCLHVGPTLVLRITDRADMNHEMPSEGSRRRHSTGRRAITPKYDDEGTKTGRPSYTMEIRLEIPAGLGISVVNNQSEELIYALFKGLEFTVIKTDDTYQMTGSVSVIQIDNQLLAAEKWPVLYCEVNALKTEGESPEVSTSNHDMPAALRMTKPALKLEMACNPREHYDAFDCFRVKLCDMCLLLDETLLWKIAQFIQETGTAESVKPKTLIQPPNIEPASISDSHAPTRRCYFGTLELEIGNLALTVLTVAKNGLPKDLRILKEQFNVKLVSFENALVSLPAFRQFHYFETLNFLVESLSRFYMAEFQKQTMKVIVTMDAFGNPQGLASDLKESFQGLLFEGDVSGFVSGLGYGVTNSISKVASSMAHGVGSLTFDEQHELMRRRMLRSQSQQDNATPLSHLYGGVKGLGVGVFGGLTALAKNTLTATQEDGISGIFRGVTTGAVDTVTKPIQGVFDFLEGSASALKEVVGGPLVRKSHFPERRIRLPRVCTNLQSLLPCYDDQLAEAQQELLRITGYSTNEILLNVVIFFSRVWQGEREVQKALICSEQCYILRQRNDQPNTVTQRIVYRLLKNVQPTTVQQSGLVKVEISYEDKQRRNTPTHVYCSDREVAHQLADRILQAKQRYDHSKRTLTVLEDVDSL